MKRKLVKHQLDGLMALLLFAIFAVCVLIVLLTGAKAYRRLTARDQEAHQARICVQYLAQRVRQADRRDGIVLEEDFQGTQALLLDADQEYVTRVYCYEGYLMELYCEAGAGLGPGDGERIMEAKSLEMDMTGDTIAMKVVTGAQNQERESVLTISLRSRNGTT